jgi:hypothetical protein
MRAALERWLSLNRFPPEERSPSSLYYPTLAEVAAGVVLPPIANR